ncbi:MAG: hypothetical protein A2Y62_04905 [Candidatus Fischerbacteria bacterium RBG_13_37_8]|uniref:Lipid A phosphate methyltransferase n=1 Tax=Candidatus Fischerbacteria bacterium RBG_13_37_8 TaxID=1817863 RepID=A0A1F5VHR7_9BACT|nr:MAG: hypothetical protein A2Y62_04905 [Candidatus Fischerbacteria bacterium RBG_13_37_8]
MDIKERLEKQGSTLFKLRSYFPFLILPILVIALQDSALIEQAFGETVERLFNYFCIAVAFSGLFTRCLTVGYVADNTSGRGTKKQEATTLNTTGMYSIVRHPLYLGNFIVFAGMTLFIKVWWYYVIAFLAFWLYYERIMIAEEGYLRQKFGELFAHWAEKTPAFIPNVKAWETPSQKFSYKMVLRREYSGIFAITTYFTILHVAQEFIATGKMQLQLEWAIFFIIGFVLYITLMILKKTGGTGIYKFTDL